MGHICIFQRHKLVCLKIKVVCQVGFIFISCVTVTEEKKKDCFSKLPQTGWKKKNNRHHGRTHYLFQTYLNVFWLDMLCAITLFKSLQFTISLVNTSAKTKSTSYIKYNILMML